jgi:lipoprotein-anchoring transpeptidase ErfK/SrfK
MTTNSSIKHEGFSKGYLFAFVISGFMLILTICGALTLTPTLASALVDSSSPTSKAPSWSVVMIAKPTYTPSPIPTFTATPINPPVSEPTAIDTLNTDTQDNPGEKDIIVSISQQHLSAYENGQLVYSFIASTGIGNSTRVGTFHVLDKIPNAYGANWDIWMPNWLGIYWSGSLENGIHALPILPDGNRLWSGYLGSPISFGCVVLNVDDALQLYNWADIGAQVEIQW